MEQEARILEILNEIRPECDFTKSANYIADGLLDSFDLVMLVPSLEKSFGVKIPGEQIVAENFVHAAAILALVERSR